MNVGSPADIALAKVLAAVLIRLYPQCYTTVEVGDAWETRTRPAHIFEMGRDNDLAWRAIRTQWADHPRARVIAAMCVR
jgi:hypothetical protein